MLGVFEDISNHELKRKNVSMMPKDKKKTASFITLSLTGACNHSEDYFSCRNTEKSIKGTAPNLTSLECKNFDPK